MRGVRAVLTGVFLALGVSAASEAQTGAPAAAPPAPAPVPQSWVDFIAWKGDLRYRHETIADDARVDAEGDKYTRVRHRTRARLGVDAKCNDRLKAAFEVSTGQADPVSGNQTLGDAFAKKDFRLSLAYADYNFLGDNPNEIHALAGKIKNPFLLFPDDLVWDHDLSQEGLALKAQWRSGPATAFVNGGYLWVQERSDKDDLMLYAGQGAVRLRFMPEIALTVGASYYAYQNMRGFDVIDWEGKNNAYGNSTTDGSTNGSTTNKAWSSEFTPVAYHAQLDVWLLRKPVSLFFQELDNTETDDFDRGHLYGVSVGKAKNPHTWELGYSHAELEKDATVGLFTDSDRWGGGADGKGHKIYGKYQIVKNLQAGMTYFLDEKKISDATKTTDYRRLQVDLVASF